MQRIIESIEFDLTSSCNSVCSGCARFKEHNGKLYRNPLLKFDQHLSVEKVKEIVKSPFVSQDVILGFVGLMGDAVAHPHFLDIVDICAEKIAQRGVIGIHTNGGLRNVDYWDKLGKKLKGLHHDVIFSIDGLKDTNHIYRRRVSWMKVMENATSFISAGGNATWKFIKFPWNFHQRKQARKLAKQMKFKSFQVVEDRDPAKERLHLKRIVDNGIKKFAAPAQSSHLLIRNDRKPRLKKDLECNPTHLNINYAGQINPCCFFNSVKTQDTLTDHYNKFVDTKNTQWNNINFNNFDDILANTWWEDLYKSRRTRPLPLCIYACGIDKKKKQINHGTN